MFLQSSPFLIFSARRRIHHNISLTVTPGLVFFCAIFFWTQKIGLDIEVILTVQQKYAKENIWTPVIKVNITLVDVWITECHGLVQLGVVVKEHSEEHSEFGNMLSFTLFHFFN